MKTETPKLSWAKRNPELVKEYRDKFREIHRERLQEYERERWRKKKERMENDLEFREEILRKNKEINKRYYRRKKIRLCDL